MNCMNYRIMSERKRHTCFESTLSGVSRDGKPHERLLRMGSNAKRSRATATGIELSEHSFNLLAQNRHTAESSEPTCAFGRSRSNNRRSHHILIDFELSRGFTSRSVGQAKPSRHRTSAVSALSMFGLRIKRLPIQSSIFGRSNLKCSGFLFASSTL